ncbi:pyridoxal-phosphate dependent enzyme, partial [Nocardia amamiensis]|uniref:pyridoxal-phosphate dependent enzyme n=1 Tax=Nocardia amamiensis TaxID=404578 RepID=UPI000B14A0A9
YGAEVVTYDRYTGDRVAIGEALAADRGLTVVPPFDHPAVMAGQGTTALELVEEVGRLDAFLAPVGGGGLMAGCATAVAALSPGARVVGVEPVAGDDTKRSLTAGKRVRIKVPRTIADAQATEIPGELTFNVNRHLLDEIVLVSDDELIAAMVFLYERMKIAVEPTGAAGIAALLSKRVELPGQRVGVIVSGGNIDTERSRQRVSRLCSSRSDSALIAWLLLAEEGFQSC